MGSDVVIAGAGCAGLSLALRMKRLKPEVRVTLVDKDHGGHPHKLWSFWTEHPNGVLPLDVPLKSWTRMNVAGPGWSTTRPLKALQYCTVDSHEFESRARAALEGLPGVEFITGSVQRVESTYREARVHLADRTLRAPYAFQSCLFDATQEPRYPVWQHFAGVVVRSDTPRFDPSTFTLMDFDVPQREGPTFMYRLPFSSSEVLHEHTVFSAKPLGSAEHRRCVHRELKRRGLADCDIVREEYGAIPMFEQRLPQRRGPRAFNLGVVGGMAKPTTGYAFLRIQQQTEHLAKTWATGRPTPLPAPAWRFRAYDTTLLHMIHHAPQQATRALQTLLRDTEADSVLRFLDERPSLREELRIVFSTLPWGPFLKSALPGLRHTPWAVEPPYGVSPALHEGAR